MRPFAARTVLTLAAATLLAAGCTGDDVNLAEAEAEMTNTAVDVIVEVSGEPEPNVSSERIACQDNALRDNGLERTSVAVGLNIGTDQDADEIYRRVADALDAHGIASERGAGGFVYADTATYGLRVQYYPDTGLLTADGTTECG